MSRLAAHLDGCGGLERFPVSASPLYCRLIYSFRTIADVPTALNGSFNWSEPAVRGVERALEFFPSHEEKLLVLGDRMSGRTVQ